MRRYRRYFRRHRPPCPLTLAVTAVVTAGITAACSAPSSHPAAAIFTPGAGTGNPAASASASSAGGTGADGFVMPPFGSNVQVHMTDWIPPADPAQVPAVVAAKNYLLAFYYAQYVGNKDDRWTAYVSGTAQPTIAQALDVPAVTTESFTGTLTFPQMTAAADPRINGAVDVSTCVDAFHMTDTSLTTGKALTRQPPVNQDIYRTTTIMAQGSNGGWYVIGINDPVFYPTAKGCP
jgi:hypothetical protein